MSGEAGGDAPVLFFKLASAGLTAMAFYRVVGRTVQMGITLVPTIGSPSSWRSFTCPMNTAVDQAVEMCTEAVHYLLHVLELDVREVEDLDFDDFIEHLTLRVNDAFH